MSAAPPPGTDEAPGPEPISSPPAPPAGPLSVRRTSAEGRGQDARPGVRQQRYGGLPPNASDRHAGGPRASEGHHRTVSDPRLAIVSADRRWRRLIN